MEVAGHILNDDRFYNSVKEWGDAQTQIDSLKAHQKDIQEGASEDFDVTKGDFKKIAEGVYDEIKVKTKLDEAESLFSITDILRNKQKNKE